MSEVQLHDSAPPNDTERMLHASLSEEHGIRHSGKTELFLSSVLPSRTAVYFMSIYFLLAFCELVPIAPLVKLFERSLCITYYDLHDPNIVPSGEEIPERLCKIPDIQTSLARIRGWKSMLDMIPVLVAIPFAKLADRHGRRRLMAVCLIGLALSYCEVIIVCAFPRTLPLPLVLISSGLLLCGGGVPSAISMMWAMASQSVTPTQRSDTFYYIFAAFYLSEFIGSLFSAVTTDISPWIPCGASLLAIFACLLQLWVPPSSETSTYSPIPADSSPVDTEDATSLNVRNRYQDQPPDGLRDTLLQKNMLLVLPAFFTGSLRYAILNLLVQYASNRFNLRISEGAYFYTETAVVNVLLFLLLVPSLTRQLRKKYGIRQDTIDLYTVKISLLLLAVGSFLIGLSPSKTVLSISVTVFASGFGSKVFTISLISAWAADDTKAALYAAVTVFQTLGHAIGDPTLQQIYASTLRPNFTPFWQGLPFFVSSGLYIISGLSVLFINLDINKHVGVRMDGRHRIRN